MENKAITDEQRSGSITGMGILLGFSLAFFSQWSFLPGAWSFYQFTAFTIGALGAFTQLFALLWVIELPLRTLKAHKRALTCFGVGVGAVLASFIVHAVLDYVVKS